MADIAEKMRNRTKIYDLVDDGNQRKSMLKAYRVKSETNLLAKEQEDNLPYYKLRTLDPIIIPPERKFEHLRGALIAPFPFRPTTPSPERRTTSAVSKLPRSPLATKLTSSEYYTKSYHNKLQQTRLPVAENGDILDLSRSVSKIMKDSHAADMYVPTRAADFRSEIRWRIQLRN